MKKLEPFFYISLLCLPLLACGGSSSSSDLPQLNPPAASNNGQDSFIPADPGALPGQGKGPFDPQYGFVDVDFSRYAAVLMGRTLENRYCYLAVLKNPDEDTPALVETNFEFNSQNPGIFMVQASQEQAYLLIGRQNPSPLGARLEIVTSFQRRSIDDAKEYRVYWQVEGQKIRGDCTSLRVVQ